VTTTPYSTVLAVAIAMCKDARVFNEPPCAEHIEAAQRAVNVLRPLLAAQIMDQPLSGFVGAHADEPPYLSAEAMRFLCAATVDLDTAKRLSAKDSP